MKGINIMKKILISALTLLISASIFVGCAPAAKPSTSFKHLEEDFGAEEYGIAFRKGENALTMEVQNILDEMVKDGTTKTIGEKWFGDDVFIKEGKFVDEAIVNNVSDKSLDDLKARKKFILGLDENFPPMGFRDDSGKIVGFDIDLATEVAKRMGVELEIQPIDWDAKELELSSGKIDVIWNGMTITDERAAAMNFGRPYIANKQIIIVPENSKIATKADLKDKKVGVQKGSSSLNAMEKEPEIMQSFKELTEYVDNVSAFMDLKAGRIDAMVVDMVAGLYIVETDAAK